MCKRIITVIIVIIFVSCENNNEEYIKEILFDLEYADDDSSGGNSEGCLYDYSEYGSENCDTAWEESEIDWATLESEYGWDCEGCSCPGDAGGGGNSTVLEDFEDISEWTNTTSSSFGEAWYIISSGYVGSAAASTVASFGTGDELSRSFYFSSAGYLSFRYKRLYVSDYNNLSFYIDGNSEWSGTNYEWDKVTVNVSSGTHTLSFLTNSNGTIYLDQLMFEPN